MPKSITYTRPFASIAVDHALDVGGFQGPANLEHDASSLLGCELASFEQQLAEVLPFHEIHGDELDSVGLSKIENANDVFMRDLTRENQFLLETF